MKEEENHSEKGEDKDLLWLDLWLKHLLYHRCLVHIFSLYNIPFCFQKMKQIRLQEARFFEQSVRQKKWGRKFSPFAAKIKQKG